MKKIIFKLPAILLSLSLLAITGCSSESNKLNLNEEVKYENISSEFMTINEPSNYYEMREGEMPDLFDLETIEISHLFTDASNHEFPDEYYFMPAQLTDQGILYGTMYPMENRNQEQLAEWNLETDEFNEHNEIKSKAEGDVSRMLLLTNEFSIYELGDNENKLTEFYIQDFKTNEKQVFYKIKNMPNLHRTQIYQFEDAVVLGVVNPSNGNRNEILRYLPYENRIEVIESNNSTDPIIHNGKIYYLLINNAELITQLIETDLSTKTKTVVFELQGANRFTYSLVGNNKDMLLTIKDDDTMKNYKVNTATKELIPYFETQWMEAIVYQNGFLTWTGMRSVPERGRLQYYLLDVENNIHYLNNDGDIFLSNKGIAWNDYKVAEQDIPKGGVYIKESSSIKYLPSAR